MSRVTVDAALVRRAQEGDADAVEAIVRDVSPLVHRLALKMLWHPDDAEDATQEILVKLVTRLAAFRGEAEFTTWAYRVAANHLLTTRKRRAEQPALSFEAFGRDLAEGLDEPFDARGIDEGLLEEEVKIGCTQGMLLCLDREHRLAYVLGEVFELPGAEAAWALGLTAASYRKRLERARRRIQEFMRGHCGLLSPDNPCRCRRRIGTAIAQGRVDPDRLLFATRRGVREMEVLRDAAAVFRSHPEPPEPRAVAERVAALARNGRLEIL